MPRFLVVSFLVLGLLTPSCAAPQRTTRQSVEPGEAICWDVPPEKPAHPVLDWCKHHPWTVGIGTGLVFVGGLIGGGIFALEHGLGAGLVLSGMH